MHHGPCGVWNVRSSARNAKHSHGARLRCELLCLAGTNTNLRRSQRTVPRTPDRQDHPPINAATATAVCAELLTTCLHSPLCTLTAYRSSGSPFDTPTRSQDGEAESANNAREAHRSVYIIGVGVFFVVQERLYSPVCVSLIHSSIGVSPSL